ncbi:MAG TPA: MBL fold metallo-hydrolase [Terriglobales bacterium]|nr:MBL fold metallo-hydrolase [Terriglobales bacterium]
MRRILMIWFSVFFLCVSFTFAKAKPLQIYFIDVEGGQSTLLVGPSGESLLIDAGWPGEDNANKILAVAKIAGIQKIDYLWSTHYHPDHAGGIPALAAKIPIGTFVNHGANVENDDDTKQVYAAYQKVIADKPHLTLKPGDRLPFKDLKVQVLTSDGKQISDPLPGAGAANPLCAAEPKVKPEPGENPQSLGALITYGKFRFLDIGDLEKDGELALACPNNLIGTVDLYLATHHGSAWSNPKAIVWALHPRVSVINNGFQKGNDPAAWQIVHDSPGLEGLWQLHFAEAGGKDHNVEEKFLANLDESTTHYLKITAMPNGTFTVLNTRNNFEKTYKK